MLAVQVLARPAGVTPATAGRASGPPTRHVLRPAAARQPLRKRAHAVPAEGAPTTTDAPAEGAGCGHKKLFDELGGAEGLKVAVDTFYGKVLGDAELAPYFDSLDMNQQKRKQVQFMQFAFGGPEGYQGRSMAEAHGSLVKNQGLDHRHFDKIKQYLGETLTEMGVKQEVIQRAAGVVESTRPDFGFPGTNSN